MEGTFTIKGFNREFILKPFLELVEVTDFMGKVMHNIRLSFAYDEDGCEQPFATFTTNFGEFIGMKNSAYIDTNNCWFSDEILQTGIAEDTGLYKFSGMCKYPLWQFKEEFLKSVNEDLYLQYSKEYDEYLSEYAPSEG